MPAPTNPLSVGYAAIWKAFADWPAFQAIFRVGQNTQINLQLPGYTPIVTANVGDRPMAKLTEGKIVGLPYQRNSKVVSLTISYPLQLASGTFQIDQIGLMNTVVIQALRGKGDQLNISDKGCYKWELAPGDIRDRGSMTRRGEWVTLINIVVTFWIPKTEFDSTTYT